MKDPLQPFEKGDVGGQNECFCSVKATEMKTEYSVFIILPSRSGVLRFKTQLDSLKTNVGP